MAKLLRQVFTLLVLLILALVMINLFYPSFKEGQFRPRLRITVNTMLSHAVENDTRDSDYAFPISMEDPVSRMPYVYGVNDTGWYIMSVGPDKIINCDINATFSVSNFIPYDPTNGYFSSGDILFTNRYSSSIQGYPKGRKGQWVRSYHGYTREKTTGGDNRGTPH